MCGPAGCENSAAWGLSGGNQQKLIIAREVDNDPDVLIAVQPTRGLDVGAIEYVHKALIEAGIRARRYCWYRWNWTRSWMYLTGSQLFMTERLWIPLTRKTRMRTTSAF